MTARTAGPARLWLCALSLWAFGAPPAAAEPPIAPAYLEHQLAAIGHVAGRRPAPGAGTGMGGCTGTLIDADLVLTAAHCAAGRVRNPEDLYITFGWRRDGPPLWRGTAAEVILSPGYRPGNHALESLPHDLALIRLPRPVPAELVTPIPLVAADGTEASFSVYGYLADADTVLRGYSDCPATQLAEALLGLSCTVQSGFSGGPVIAQTVDGAVVAAVAVANIPGRQTGIRSIAAIPPPEFVP
ncbi:MAG: trypsin-like serine protease [Pseudomonadota bacterium]